MIYLDFAASTPMSTNAVNVFNEAATDIYGNSSSHHDIGGNASNLLTECRIAVANLIAAESKGLYFTSGGSEANYLAINSLLKASDKQKKHLISTPAEHASLRNIFQQLAKEGYEISLVELDKNGAVCLKKLNKLIRDDTCLVSIAHANSETGLIQELKNIGELLADRKILFHSDCVQTFAKIPLSVTECKLSSISLSAHKIYGPKGVGALYIDPTIPWQSIYHQASHEDGMRPGTVNVPGIAAFTVAAQDLYKEMSLHFETYSVLREYFLQQVAEYKLPIVVEGGENVLPNIIGFRMLGLEGQYTMLECNRRQIALATGSACQTGSHEPAASMTATGKSADEAREFVRASFGITTTAKDIDALIQALQEIHQDLHPGK